VLIVLDIKNCLFIFIVKQKTQNHIPMKSPKKKSLSLFLSVVFLIMVLISCRENSIITESEEIPIPERLLLKDYQPETIYNVPVTIINKAKYRVIDMHAHDYARSAEGLDDWVKIMDEVGIEKTIILSKEHGKKFDSLFDVYAKYPDRFEVWCGFDYTGYEEPGFGPDAVAELSYHWPLHALNLPDDVLEKIYSTNALKILK